MATDEGKKIEGKQIDPNELNVAFLAVRAHVDKTQYGSFISDDVCKKVAAEVLTAVENYRAGEEI